MCVRESSSVALRTAVPAASSRSMALLSLSAFTLWCENEKERGSGLVETSERGKD